MFEKFLYSTVISGTFSAIYGGHYFHTHYNKHKPIEASLPDSLIIGGSLGFFCGFFYPISLPLYIWIQLDKRKK